MGLFVAAVNLNNVMTRNVKQKDKAAARLSSGEKINSAQDDPSAYAVSEKMQVRMRALDQNDDNVKKGTDLLQVAAGGIQTQIDLLRLIKKRTIDANNDTNTDADRKTIQQEIDQYYTQIQDISDETSYNGMALLNGGAGNVARLRYEVLGEPAFIDGSDSLKLIQGQYPSLDGKQGPFDAFSRYEDTYADIASLGISAGSGLQYSGGTDGTPHAAEMDFSGYSLSALDGTGFYTSPPTRYYVLTADPSKKYVDANGNDANKIDISDCTDIASVLAKIAGTSYYGMTASVGPGSDHITFTSDTKDYTSNSMTIGSWSAPAGSVTIPGTPSTPEIPAVPAKPAVPALPPTGLFPSRASFTGGADAHGEYGDIDNPYVPAKNAGLEKDISSAADGTSITVHGYGGDISIKFVDGDAAPTIDDNGRYIIGKNYTGSFSGNSINFAFNNGKMTLTSNYAGSYGNSYSVTDGVDEIPAQPAHDAVPAVPGTPDTTVATQSVTGFLTDKINNDAQIGVDGDPAHADIDLSDYNTADMSKLEAFIKDLSGKGIEVEGLYTYQFVDGGSPESLENINTLTGSGTIDLNSLRSAVAGGKTIADAFADLLQGRFGSFGPRSVQKVTDGNTPPVTIGVSFISDYIGRAGNGHEITGQQAIPSHYDIDFTKWMTDKGIKGGSLPDMLDGKGFRIYCATDNDQWFNFVFTNGVDSKRPKSGTKNNDIKSFSIDVSKVTDAGSLVKAIYDQTMPLLTGSDPFYNHFMRVAADTKTGVLTIYDNRLRDTSGYPNAQEEGAKIADGIFDNVVRRPQIVSIKNLVIQHTPKASQNIRLQIPATSLKDIFDLDSTQKLSDYNVLTKKARTMMLGTDKIGTNAAVEGALDVGITYLTDAASTLGNQMIHLMSAHDSITTQNENVTASESTIRDSNMAKEMADYVRYNILTQTAQTSLLHNNQSMSSVLSLLGSSGQK